MLPGVAPCTIGEHIANSITGNGFPVPASQQVAPIAVAVGVAVADSAVIEGQQIARIIIAVAFRSPSGPGEQPGAAKSQDDSVDFEN